MAISLLLLNRDSARIARFAERASNRMKGQQLQVSTVGRRRLKLQIPIALGCVFDQATRVLLVRRSEPRNRCIDNRWELPGGKIDFGEPPSKTAEREILEETGVHVEAAYLLPFAYIAVRHSGACDLNPIVICFR